MPRASYTPKNRLCRNSNLTEEQLLHIIWHFVQASSAPDAYEMMSKDARIIAPSVKTIGKEFRRLGEYLFHEILEPFFLELFPQANAWKEFPELYERWLDSMVDSLAKTYLRHLDYGDYRVLTDGVMRAEVLDDHSIEFRKVVASRQGIKSTIRGDIALTHFRVATARHFAPSSNGRERTMLMCENLKQMLLNKPL